MSEQRCGTCRYFYDIYVQRPSHNPDVSSCNYWPKEDLPPPLARAIEIADVLVWSSDGKDCPAWEERAA